LISGLDTQSYFLRSKGNLSLTPRDLFSIYNLPSIQKRI